MEELPELPLCYASKALDVSVEHVLQPLQPQHLATPPFLGAGKERLVLRIVKVLEPRVLQVA